MTLRIRVWLWLLLVLGSPPIVWGQTPGNIAVGPLTATTCTATGGLIQAGCVVLPIPDLGSAAIELVDPGSGTWTAQFEATTDPIGSNATFSPINMVASNGTTPTTSTSTTGLWTGSIAGYTQLRVRLSSFSSGTPRVTIHGVQAGGTSGAGGAGGGGGTSSNFTSVFPASGTAIGFKDTGGNMAAGNLDSSGRVIVDCGAGCNAASDTTASGSLAAANNSVSAALAGLTSASFTLPSGNNLVGTLVAEYSSDNATTWQATLLHAPEKGWAASVAVSSTQQTYNMQVPGGASHVRVRVSAYTSGSATASVRITQQPEAVPFFVAQAADTLPTGVVQVGGTDGSVLRALSVDSSGRPQVNITQVAGANAAALSDTLSNPTTFQVGANLLGWDAVNAVMRRVQVTTSSGRLQVDPSAVTSPINLAQVGGSSVSLGQKTMANSIPVVIASDQSAVAISGSVSQSGTWTVQGGLVNNNAVPGSNNIGALTGLVNTGSGPSYTNGNLALPWLSGTGQMHTVVDNGSLTLTDAATQTGGQANIAATIAMLQGWDPIQAKYERLYLDPCQGNQHSWVAINQTATTQVLGLSGSAKKYYICDIHVVTASTQNVSVIDSTTAGNACATSPSGFDGLGGSTAGTGWNFAANGGIALGTAANAVGVAHDANSAMCIAQSGTGQVSGGFTYVIQ